MASSTLSETAQTTPTLSQDCLGHGIIIALFEDDSLSRVSYHSLPPLKYNGYQTTEKQKLEHILAEVKAFLKHMACIEKTTDEDKGSQESTIFKDVSDLKEKIRGLKKTNQALLKDLLDRLDFEKDQDTTEEEIILENHHTQPICARHMINHTGGRTFSEMQLSREKAKHRFPSVYTENTHLRPNMEQLFQETEHCHKQHTDLRELIRSYHPSQKNMRDNLRSAGTHQVHFQRTHEHTKFELEEQVKKLKEDTDTLHLVANLLESDCQVLAQRIELLKKHHQNERVLQMRQISSNCDQDKREEKLLETEQEEIQKQKSQDMGGICQRKDKFYRSLDVCHHKKAHNNRFNMRIARKSFSGRKRHPAA